MPKNKIASVKAPGLNAIYDAWKQKHHINTPFRVGIAHSPHDPKQEGENWGALIDCIVRFAQEKNVTDGLEKIEITVITAYGALGAITYRATKQAMGEDTSESDALFASLTEGHEWKKKHIDPLLKSSPIETINITFKVLFWAEVNERQFPIPIIDANVFPEYRATLEATAQEFVKREMRRLNEHFFEMYLKEMNIFESRRILNAAKDTLYAAAINYLQREVGPLNYLPVDVVVYPEEVPVIQEARKAYIKMSLPQSDESLWIAYTVGKVEDLGKLEHAFARKFRNISGDPKNTTVPILHSLLFSPPLLPPERSPSASMVVQQPPETEKKSASLPASPFLLVPETEWMMMRQGQARMMEEQARLTRLLEQFLQRTQQDSVNGGAIAPASAPI